jgi:hypothetical protein
VKPPVRWLDGGEGVPRGAADLLSAAEAPPPFTDPVRYRLGVGVAKTASLPIASIWSSLLAKGAFVAVIGGASGYGVHLLASKHDAATAAAVVPVSKQAPPVVSAAAPAVAVDALPVLQLPTTVPPEHAPHLKLDSRLEEAELLEKARSLVGANPGGALKLVSEYARDYPKGKLGAEADLIAAQSLLGMGKTQAAQERAKASLKRYPNGLYARQLREIAGTP